MRFIIYLLAIILVTSCGGNNQKPNHLKIGTIAGPETEIVELASKIAKKRYNLQVDVVAFQDYNLPNEALHSGDLDANVFQHYPFLKNAMINRGYKFSIIGKTFIYPTGLYSQKWKSITELPTGALIAIPSDPSNQARALILLASAKLINLPAKDLPSIEDITLNKKNLRFKELDAAQLPRILADVDGAIINTTFAIPAGLNPFKNAILLENKDSPYANLIVINSSSNKKEQIKLFVKAMQTKTIANKAKELFGVAAIPAWDNNKST